MRTGWNTAGTALEARTATPGSPRWNRMGAPESRSVATTPSGSAICSIVLPPVCWRTKRASASPRISPRPGKAQSVMDDSSIASASWISSPAVLPEA